MWGAFIRLCCIPKTDQMMLASSHLTARRPAAARTDVPSAPDRVQLDEQKLARPERDVLTDFLDRLQGLQSPAAERARQAARQQWMSGDFSNATVRALLEGVRGDDHDVNASVEHALQKIQGPQRPISPVLKEYHQNQYGRHFESTLIRRLVENPPSEALDAGATQTTFLKNYLAKALKHAPEETQQTFFVNLANNIKNDKRQWFPATPEIGNFLADPISDTCESMFQVPKNGFDLVKDQYLAVHVSTQLREVNLTPPWLKNADELYPGIQKSRTTIKKNNEYPTKQYGIGLAGQPKFTPIPNIPEFSDAHSWADEKEPNFAELESLHALGYKHFEEKALTEGQVVVTGVSGSAIVLEKLNQYIQRSISSHSSNAASLNSLMFLNLDGGHSCNEVMAVHRVLSPHRRAFFKRQELKNQSDAIRRYRLNYHEIPGLLPNGNGRRQVRMAMEQSLDDTVAHFGEHGYREPSFTEQGKFYYSMRRQLLE